MAEGVKLFLSCVSNEFGSYRDALRDRLDLPNVEVKIQENFKGSGADTLRMLADYVENCDTVVHFFGDMNGAAPEASTVDDLLSGRPKLESRLAAKGLGREALKTLTYTQWEAWLAVGFDKDLVIIEPADGAPPSPTYAPTTATRASQAEHLKRLRAVNRYPEKERFTSADNLIALIFLSAVRKALIKAGAMPERQPRNLPFPSLGPLFKGREAALGALRAALVSGQGAAVTGRALHGLGGIGKTRLTIEYALLHAADYSALLFVRADSPATLNANLAALASGDVLNLPEKEAKEDAVKIEAALNWLAANPTWLMILDNVDDDEAVKAVSDLMARLKGGHVIVTARAADFPASLQTLELDVLDDDAARAFLMDRTRSKRAPATDDGAKSRELAHELSGLALGLEQAGAYIERQRIGFARYLKLWREKRETVLNWFDKSLMSYDHDVGLAATWATSVEKLTPASRRLLDRLAFLAPDPIPNSLLDVPVPGETADYDTYEARAGLYAYSLAAQAKGEDGAAKGFVVHRLVQDFARRAMTDERRAEAPREALEWVNSAFPFDADDARTWPVLDPLAPHALAVARWADETGIGGPTGRLFNQLGLLFVAKARYAEAEPLYLRALAIFEANLGPNHPQVATSLNNLAGLLRATNRFPEAEALYRRALATWDTRGGPNHLQIAISLNNLAGLLCDTNRLIEAEPLYRRALRIGEASYGPDHPNVATSLDNLAELLRETNRFGEAEPLYRRALAIREKSYGPGHPDAAHSLNNLAFLLKDTNRLAEAEPLFRRALAIFETSYGPDHPHVATGFNNLALLLKETNRLAEAEPLFRRALAIREASYGPDHPDVAQSLNNLALLLKETNRLAEAEPLYRRALTIDEASYGLDHPHVATCLNNLAGLLRKSNRTSEAEQHYRRALAIFEKSYGPDHPNVATGLNNLAALFLVTNRVAQIEPLMRRSLAIFETSLGPDHPNTVTARQNLAGLLAALGKQA